MSGPVVVLAGGTGGAKLARGMLDVVDAQDLVIVANTGDDIEIYGAYVSPDPDLITFWLADLIDERGWGIKDDTFNVMSALRDLGKEIWFNLGDRDLAIGLERARMLREGDRLTHAQRILAQALGVKAAVLPMSDQPVRTHVVARGCSLAFQEFMIRSKAQGPIDGVDFRGARAASATPEVDTAIKTAAAIVIGPSNPVISIGPILAVTGVREALKDTQAPVVGVSPFVRGQVVKGPTETFMAFTKQPKTTDGIAAIYDGLLDGIVADERASRLPTFETDVLMDTPQARERLARETLNFALSLG